MLAQNFKTAADLGITEPQLSALQKTLVLLETGKLVHTSRPKDKLNWDADPVFAGRFNMDAWDATFESCGTIACIGGTAEMIGGVDFGVDHEDLPNNLYHLFYPFKLSVSFASITATQAATALRSYLTTGDARWDLAVA